MNISVNVTSMFRDPEFFKRLIDIIKIDYQPSDNLRIWHPGCSEGNEVYSLAILLHEANLLSNTLLYGTDISHEALLIAKEASIRVEHLKIFSSDYRIASGKYSLKDYFNRTSTILLSYLESRLVIKYSRYFFHNRIYFFIRKCFVHRLKYKSVSI